MNQRWRAIAIVVLMLSSIPMVVERIGSGWDLLNVYAFHHCQERNAPYTQGVICDERTWPMNYPPLLYWSFAWVRALSFSTAYLVWGTVIASGVVWAAWLWGAGWFAIGLLLIFPTVYAIDSGNNDVAILILWSLAWLAWRRSFFWSGVLAGASVAYKLYPGFALALVVAVLAVKERRALRGFISGAGCALVLQAIVFARDWWAYVPGNLTRYVEQVREPAWYTHAVPGLASSWLGDARWGLIVSGLLFLAWGRALVRVEDPDRRLLFAGALALSTYVVQTSYDYNLLTTYPLLAILIAASVREQRSNATLLVCLAGLFAVGHRNIYLWAERGRLWPAVLQVAWLLSVVLWNLRPLSGPQLTAGPDRERDEAARQPRTAIL